MGLLELGQGLDGPPWFSAQGRAWGIHVWMEVGRGGWGSSVTARNGCLRPRPQEPLLLHLVPGGLPESPGSTWAPAWS